MDRLASGRLTDGMMRTLTILGAIDCAAMGGVFLAFSAFVMPALKRLPPADGLSAMQSINVTAVRPALMTGLLGTAVICVVLVVRGASHWGDRHAVLLVAGGAVYLVGVIGLTIAYNVPLNDSLATLDPTAAASLDEWTTYLRNWTAANHVRALAGAVASAALALSLVESAG
jgi:uncharacterized membrane protein